jgi:Kef-type K+ transport system membrane component KefB
MTLHEYEALRDAIGAADPDRRDKIGALKQLRYRSDWFESFLAPRVIDPIKTLRSWAFVLCFLCIGLSTRIRDLLTFGLKPFWAFTIGVAVNVPLGYFLSTVVFSRFWSNIGEMM